MNIRRKFLAACVAGVAVVGVSTSAQAQVNQQTNQLTLIDGANSLTLMPPTGGGAQTLTFPVVAPGTSFIMSSSLPLGTGQNLLNGLAFTGSVLSASNALVSLTPSSITATSGPYYGFLANITESAGTTSGNTAVIGVRATATEGATSDDEAVGGWFSGVGNGGGPVIGGRFSATGGLTNVGLEVTAGGANITGATAVTGTLSSTGVLSTTSAAQVTGEATLAGDAAATSMRVKTVDGAGWDGFAAFGGVNDAVVMGEIGSRASLGGHNGTLTTWTDLYINEGGSNVRIGSAVAPTSTLDVAGTLGASGTATFSAATPLDLSHATPVIATGLAGGALTIDDDGGNDMMTLTDNGTTATLAVDAISVSDLSSTSLTAPNVYGGTAAAATLNLEGSSHATPAGDVVTITSGNVAQVTVNSTNTVVANNLDANGGATIDGATVTIGDNGNTSTTIGDDNSDNFVVNSAGFDVTAAGNVTMSAVGSTTAAPRTLMMDYTGGVEATALKFGDDQNAITNSFAGRTKLISYWGLEIHGSHQGAATADFPAGAVSDDAVTIYSSNAGRKALTVNGAASQTADLQEWQVNGTEVARVTAAGAIDAASLTLDTELDEAEGGTGNTTYATGDLLYASGANTLAKRTIGSTGDILTVTGGVPVWESGSGNFIENQNAGPQSSANFNIDGAGSIGTTLAVGGGANNSFSVGSASTILSGRDVAGTEMPFEISTNVSGLTFGNAGGQTAGRVMRMSYTDDAGAAPLTGRFDIAVDENRDLYISKNNQDYTAIVQMNNTTFRLAEDIDLAFEGATDDGNELTVVAADPSADVSATIPALAVNSSFVMNEGSTTIGDNSTATVTIGDGDDAFVVASTGVDITAAGAISGATTVDASTNYQIGGTHALSLLATGNTRVGQSSGAAIVGGVGAGAGEYNTTLGFQAGRLLTTGDENTFLGTQAGDGVTTGNQNTIIGKDAGYQSSGDANTMVGIAAGYNTTGDNNVFAGNAAGFSNTTGANNTYLGTGTSGPVGATNATALGNGATATASNQVVLGNGSVTEVTTAGALNSAGLTSTGNITVSGAQILGASPLVFEGTTDDNITTIFAITDPTVSNKTITFPNATGTVALTSDLGDYLLLDGTSAMTGNLNMNGNDITNLDDITFTSAANTLTFADLGTVTLSNAAATSVFTFTDNGGTAEFTTENVNVSNDLAVTGNASIDGNLDMNAGRITEIGTAGSNFTVAGAINISTPGSTIGDGTTDAIQLTVSGVNGGATDLTVTGEASVSNGLTVSAGGANITGGINNNTGGITNAGAITGATGYTGTGTVNTTLTTAGNAGFYIGVTGSATNTNAAAGGNTGAIGVNGYAQVTTGSDDFAIGGNFTAVGGASTGANAYGGRFNASGGLVNLAVLAETGDVRINSLTASRPVLSDGDKDLVSGSIDLANTNHVTGVLDETNGGTGVANAAGETITLGGAMTTSGTTIIGTGTDNVTFNTGGNTSITLPTSGTVATTANTVNFDVVAQQVSSDPSNYLFNVVSNTASGSSLGARIVADGNVAVADNATALTLAAAAGSSGTATALSLAATGGATNNEILAADGTINTTSAINTTAAITAGTEILIGANRALDLDALDNVMIGTASQPSTGTDNIIIGRGSGGSISTTSQNVVIGDLAGTTAMGTGNSIVGRSANVTAAVDYATVMGQNASATGNQGVAIGTDAAVAVNSLALGAYAAASGTNSIAIGRQASNAVDNSIVLGNSSITNVSTSGTYTSSAATALDLSNTDPIIKTGLATNGSDVLTFDDASNGDLMTLTKTATGGSLAVDAATVSTVAINGSINGAGSGHTISAADVSANPTNKFAEKVTLTGDGARVTYTIPNTNAKTGSVIVVTSSSFSAAGNAVPYVDAIADGASWTVRLSGPIDNAETMVLHYMIINP